MFLGLEDLFSEVNVHLFKAGRVCALLESLLSRLGLLVSGFFPSSNSA